MAIRRFNWKLLLVILIGLAVLTVTAFGLRTWQKNRMASGRLTSGNRAYEMGQWQRAASDLGKYIAVSGGMDVPVLLKYADAQLNIRPLTRDNIQQAISTYRSILRLQPDNYDASRKLIELYLQMDMHGESELIARRQLKQIDDPNIRRMLVMALVGQRKFREAAVELNSIIQAHPNDVQAYEALSRLCEQRPEEFGKSAEFWLDEAVRKNPSSAMAYVVRAAFEFRKNKESDALADFERAQKLDLSATDVRLRLARELINAGQLSAAKEHLAAIQAAQPKNQMLWQAWAMLASKSGIKPEMLRVARTGMEELAPSNLDFMPVATELFIAGGDYDAAERCVETLSAQNIAPGSAALFKGMLAEHHGQQYQAVKFYRLALQLGNKNSTVRFRLAELLAKLGDEQAAIQQMRLLISEQPEIEAARVYLATLLLRNDGAVEAAQQALSLLQDSPQNPDAKAIYAQAQITLLGANNTSAAKIMNIDEKIRELESSSVDQIRAKLLRFQLAIKCAEFDKAAQVLSELKKIAPDDLETAIAGVDFLVAQNKVDDAKGRLAELIKKFPDSPEVVQYMVKVLNSIGQYDECQLILASATDRIKDTAAQREFELLRAQEFRRAGKFDEACKTLDSLDKKFENDIAVKKELLRLDSVARDGTRVQRLIGEIKDFEGQQGTQWRYEQARIWFGSSDFEKHVSEIVSLLNSNLYANPDDNESRLLLAMTYDKAGQRRLAIAAYRDALSRAPQDLRIIIPAVAALYKSGEYDEADKIVKSAAEQNVSHPQLSGYELRSNLRHGQLQSAAQILDDMRAADPNNDALNLYLATIEMRQNNFEEASKLLTVLKSRQPGSVAVFTAMVELNWRQNKTADAIALCDEAVQKIKTAQTYVLRGHVRDMLGETQLAQQDFDRATAIEPNNGEAWAAKARFATARGQNGPAAAAWEKCVVLSPDNPQIREESLEFFIGSSDIDMNRRGRKMLQEALEANPDDQRLQLWQARTLLLDKTAPAADKAVGILTKITAARSSDIDGWVLLCQAWLQKNEPAKALDAVLRGLVFLPDNRTLLLLKARTEAAHTPELAIPTVKLLHEKDPNDVDVAIYLTSLYMHGNNYRDAIAVLDGQLLLADPKVRRKINIVKAVALHKKGDKVQARKLFDSLTKEDPNDVVLMLAEAGLLKDEQKWDDLVSYVAAWHQNHGRNANAVIVLANDLTAAQSAPAKKAAEEILRNAFVADPNSPQLLSELAKLAYLSGRSSEAMELYRRLAELDPENLTALNNLAWIMCEMGRYEQALGYAQKGLRISPDYLDLVDTRGMAYFRLGKFDKAVEDFTTCAKLYPSHVPSAAASYFHLGRTLAVLAKKEEAVKYLKMALESNQKIGGLSANDVTEARNLLDGLSKG